jgi:hypothetical protein
MIFFLRFPVGEWFGKERLVLDLRHVNTFVDKQKVKFEGVKEAMVYTKYAIKFDLIYCV